MIDILWLVVSLAIILAGAETFTNSIEWLGKKLNLGAGAVGSVLAAVGTALPETLLPVIAIIGGNFGDNGGHGEDVGIGAILGAPFMLATLAMFLTGVTAFLVRRKQREQKSLNIIFSVMSRDIGFFILVYTVAILASFVPEPLGMIKSMIAVFLVAAYGFYVYRTVKGSMGKHDEGHTLAPLYLMRRSKNPGLGIVGAQILVSLGIIVLGAHIFVKHVEIVAEAMGVPVLVLALIIAPLATELPEKFNSIIWVSRGQDTLALGNITGAMVFQSSLLPALGIAMTPWRLEPVALLSAVLALLAACWLFVCLRRTRTLTAAQTMFCGVFYVVFIVAVVGGWL
ncbi:MAG: sodium:calcium antiporter [Peptococcaceae bacterium]|nr:sodium:calcium antiporter [Peptococcaceae bacterium]